MRRFYVFRGLLAFSSLVLLAGLAACAPAKQVSAPQAIGGPFVLTNQNGARTTEAVLRGKWTLVFFGYTFCPDICPVTLSNLGAAIERMGGEARNAQVVFITVDPDRDTASQLKTYLSSPSFPPATIGLTGTTAQVADVARAYHVYFHKNGVGRSYGVDHTSVVYLMNPRGQFDRPLDIGAPPASIALQIESAMHGA